jgi:hypothetical protein
LWYLFAFFHKEEVIRVDYSTQKNLLIRRLWNVIWSDLGEDEVLVDVVVWKWMVTVPVPVAVPVNEKHW